MQKHGPSSSPRKMKSMYEVAKMAMNVQKFANALHKPQFVPDRQEMRMKFIMATTSPPQKPKQPELRLPRQKRNQLRNVAYTEGGEELRGDEEEEESSQDEDEKLDFYQRKQKELEAFYKKLIYDLPDAPKATKRTADLSKPKKLQLVNVYKEFKEVFEPPREKRVKRKVKEFQVMTTEQLEQHLKNEEAKKKDTEKIRKKRNIIYRKMLNKLDRQCREKYLEKLFRRFSKYLSECAVVMENIPDICPSNVQRLITCIQHNIYQTCKITPEDQKINGSLYRGIAACIGWLVVETLFIAQSVSGDDIFQAHDVPRTAQTTELTNVLQRRAMIAAKKQQPINRAEKCLSHGAPPKIDEIVRLCHMIGGR